MNEVYVKANDVYVILHSYKFLRAPRVKGRTPIAIHKSFLQIELQLYV